MVCLTSCVFRSIRFSGFARPHFGVRREGELYTRLQVEGKGGSMSPRDAHKSGDNRSLGGFPGPRCQTGPGAGGAGTRWTGAHDPARPLQFRAGSKGLPLFIS